MRRAEIETHECDLFLAIGSSLVVYPAAGFVEQVRDTGRAHTVELNLEPSEAGFRYTLHFTQESRLSPLHFERCTLHFALSLDSLLTCSL